MANDFFVLGLVMLSVSAAAVVGALAYKSTFRGKRKRVEQQGNVTEASPNVAAGPLKKTKTRSHSLDSPPSVSRKSITRCESCDQAKDACEVGLPIDDVFETCHVCCGSDDDSSEQSENSPLSTSFSILRRNISRKFSL